VYPNASNWVNDTIVNFPSDHHGGEAYGLYYKGIMQDFTVRHLEIDHADYGVFLQRTTGPQNYDIQLANLIVDQFVQYGAFFKVLGMEVRALLAAGSLMPVGRAGRLQSIPTARPA
jgi:hypothetical protein